MRFHSFVMPSNSAESHVGSTPLSTEDGPYTLYETLSIPRPIANTRGKRTDASPSSIRVEWLPISLGTVVRDG